MKRVWLGINCKWEAERLNFSCELHGLDYDYKWVRLHHVCSTNTFVLCCGGWPHGFPQQEILVDEVVL